SAEGERRRHLNLACCPNCELESRWLARSAVSDLVVPMDTPMRRPHVYKSGFDPTVNVRLRHSFNGGHDRRGGLDVVKDASFARAGAAGAVHP
ncbi:MAG: hypothetical protein WA624_01895, partial [Methylocella sp.]